ncbi:hypothetical protein SADUNF_Sadunf14G0098500 [Salix dunnii]|uniref:Uncharacterized protein n=1 Tax=Salix dunnii TaxID=1413687 RepID=A0A835MMF5_9ROSI|nr:hypothetical protein SADUNF_Sadunf14G0098500 [Salix dunnii]
MFPIHFNTFFNGKSLWFRLTLVASRCWLILVDRYLILSGDHFGPVVTHGKLQLSEIEANKLEDLKSDNIADYVCSVQWWGEDGSCGGDVNNGRLGTLGLGWGCSFVEAARLEHDSELNYALYRTEVPATFAINKPYLTPPSIGFLISLQVNAHN